MISLFPLQLSKGSNVLFVATVFQFQTRAYGTFSPHTPKYTKNSYSHIVTQKKPPTPKHSKKQPPQT